MVRISDIIDSTGYSRATVSGILNGRHTQMGISSTTVEKVLKAARDLGYVRNEISQGMRTGKSNTFGCIIGSLGQEWEGRILAGALERLKETPFSLRLSSGTGFENEIAALEHIIAGRPSGLFVSNVNPPPAMVKRIHAALANYDIPVVSNNCSEGFTRFRVEADNFEAGRLAASHLINLGHKKIAFINGDRHPSSDQRLDGFRHEARTRGITINDKWICSGQWIESETKAATRFLLSVSNRRPTAILAANHVMAAFAMNEARRMGLSVPKDLSIMGITDETLCEVLDPPLSTISIDEQSIGSNAMDMLLRFVEHPELRRDGRVITSPVFLIERGTTAPPSA